MSCIQSLAVLGHLVFSIAEENSDGIMSNCNCRKKGFRMIFHSSCRNTDFHNISANILAPKVHISRLLRSKQSSNFATLWTCRWSTAERVVSTQSRSSAHRSQGHFPTDIKHVANHQHALSAEKRRTCLKQNAQASSTLSFPWFVFLLPVGLLLLVTGLVFGCLWLKVGLVFSGCGGGLVWSFYLRFPPVRILDLVFSACGSPTVSKKDKP